MRRLHRLAAAPSTLRAASCIGLEKIEILVVLPGGRLVALPYPGLLEPLGKPARLVALEFEVIIDKYVAELAAKQRFALEGVQGPGDVHGPRRNLGVVSVTPGRLRV